MLRAPRSLELAGNYVLSVVVCDTVLGPDLNPQQTSEDFYVVSYRTAEKYHDTYAREGRVGPK